MRGNVSTGMRKNLGSWGGFAESAVFIRGFYRLHKNPTWPVTHRRNPRNSLLATRPII